MNSHLLYNDIREIVSKLPIGVLSRLKGKHLLLTGGRGFLGRYFSEVFHFLNENHLNEVPLKVTVFDNLISSGSLGEQPTAYPNFNIIHHNTIHPFPQLDPVDYIFYAAGIASPAHYRKYPLETLEVATIGLKHALELARTNPGSRLAFFSSSEIYGDPDPTHIPTNESYRGNVACLGPRACYDMSKRLGETLVEIYHQQHGVLGTIIRPFNVYGPGMQKTDYRVLPNFASRIADRLPLQIYGRGEQTRTFCYITDAIDGFLRVLLDGVPGEPYNIGNPKPEISMLELVEKVREVRGYPKIEFQIIDYPDTYPADEPNRRCPDITKAMRQLGYSPTVSLEDGLDRFFSWTSSAYSQGQQDSC
jgi:UDP-glucuronate decarboxylase